MKTLSSEVVWGDGHPDDSGTGGGYSTIFPIQAFQVGAPLAPKGLGRMVPDVAGIAAGGYLIALHGEIVGIGGTSAVSPLYAGLCAASGRKLGFITPTLWKHPKAFVDIAQGSNGAYSAAVGPDPCTGLGVPNGATFADLFSSTGQTFTLSVTDATSGNYNANLSFNNPVLGQYSVNKQGLQSTTGTGSYTQVPPSGVVTIVSGTSSTGSQLFFGTYAAVIIDWKASGIPFIFDNTRATISGAEFGLNLSKRPEFYFFSGHD